MKHLFPALTFGLLMLVYLIHPVAGYIALASAFAYVFRRQARRVEVSR